MAVGDLNGSEVARHDSADSCWVIVYGKVYDVTEFVPDHPGGQQSILKHADIRQQREEPKHPPQPTGKPPLSHCLNLSDFESVARQVLDPTSWAYFSSAADDEITLQENYRAFHRVWFRPRKLSPLLHHRYGSQQARPPGRRGRLHSAAGTHGIIHMIPTLSSCALDDIVDARRDEDQVQWMQLYVNEDRDVTKQIVQQAEKRGCKGLFITVDNPQVGRREKDLRARQRAASRNGEAWHPEVYQGTSTFLDSTLSWDDLPWFQSITDMPIVLKGIQSVEDVLQGTEHGVAGVVLSNHGGRQLEFARSSLEVLAETMPVLRARGLQDKIDVFVDGGVRRGTDILKALCLGARGVGIGRGLLYRLGAYGQPGVESAIQLLRDELERGMRLLGVRNVGELHAGLVTADSLARHSGYHIDGPRETLYEPLEVIAPGGKSKL
ncbi:Cytochrome b2 like protein [Verticillium longisporum]|uniref:Cytochrome b2 like protein n=1 Tax=Verticillium longisporum TaxID=100787 RepID=A0A8I2Z5H9_VERLO|nr:Cytochrome b2 like protein [Verticillium longisporum]